MRDTLLIIHILAAGAWIGTNVVQFFVNPRINDQDTVIAAYWHRTVVGGPRPKVKWITSAQPKDHPRHSGDNRLGIWDRLQ